MAQVTKSVEACVDQQVARSHSAGEAQSRTSPLLGISHPGGDSSRPGLNGLPRVWATLLKPHQAGGGEGCQLPGGHRVQRGGSGRPGHCG